jgi:protein-tyrosine phosphatase
VVRHIDLEGGFNVRDLGGLPTHDGRLTSEFMLIRAGSLDKLTLQAQQKLINYGVKTIIDLRDEWEVRDYPNVFVNSTDVQYWNLPLIGDRLSQDSVWTAETDRYAELHELYAHYLVHCQPQIRAIFSAIAEGSPTTLFHCYAGKDRTGIVAALLLGVAGVPDGVIADDYAETTAQISHLKPRWLSYAIEHEEDMQRFERNTGSDARTMAVLLDNIRQRYGDIAAYLQHCGVSPDQLEGLKKRFVL